MSVLRTSGWPTAADKSIAAATLHGMGHVSWLAEGFGGRRKIPQASVVLAVRSCNSAGPGDWTSCRKSCRLPGAPVELMCLLGRTFVWIRGLGPKRACRIPHDIKQELRLAALQVLIAEADLGSPVSTKVFCSDATPGTGDMVPWSREPRRRPCSTMPSTEANTPGSTGRVRWPASSHGANDSFRSSSPKPCSALAGLRSQLRNSGAGRT